MLQASLFAEAPKQYSWGSLRPYQVRQKNAAEAALTEARSTLVVAATGTGKTTLLSAVAKDFRGRVLVIAHRDEILQQLLKRLELITGEQVGLEQAESLGGSHRIVVASIQTISQPKRLERWPMGHFGLVIIDEAHHAIAATYRRVLEHFGDAKVLGVTATPDRGDNKAMGAIFESVADVYDILDAIKDGMLVPIEGQAVQVAGMDLSKCRTTGGDLNAGDLDEAMAKVLEGTVHPILNLSGTRRTVVFTTGVETAHRMAAIFNTVRPSCAIAVDGSTDKDQRRAMLRDYAEGRVQYLINVGIATEGWDDPETSCVAVARPTKSRALYAQMCGRGLRTAPGKANCLILDFCGNSGRHELNIVRIEDLLGGLNTSEEIQLAKERRKKNPGLAPDKALDWARGELERRAKAKVQYAVSHFDPFKALGIGTDRDRRIDRAYNMERASQRQREALVRMCLFKDLNSIPETMSKREASKIMETCHARRNKGLAAPWRVKELASYGWTDMDIPDSNARSLIEEYRRNKGRVDLQRAMYIARGQMK